MTFLGNFCGIFGKAHTEISESEGLIRATGLLTCGYETAETAAKQRINCYINKCIKLRSSRLLKLFVLRDLPVRHMVTTCR